MLTTLQLFLLWRDQVNEIRRSYCNQISMLKKMRYLLSKLLQDVYFKTIIPHVTFSISAWGSCSPATSFLISVGIEGLHLRAAMTIHSLLKDIMNCDLLQPRLHWQSLGCIYKRRLAI
ncbi:unnamed protein product, partial [Porites evermanni]